MKAIMKKNMCAFIGKRPIVILKASETVCRALSALPEHDVGAAGVIDETGRLVGIVTVRDLLKRVLGHGKAPESLLIHDIMTAAPVTVSVKACAQDTLELMTRSGYRYLPIMDGETMIGMADIRDLYQTIQDLLHQKTSLMARMFSEPYGYDPYGYGDKLAEPAGA